MWEAANLKPTILQLKNPALNLFHPDIKGLIWNPVNRFFLLLWNYTLNYELYGTMGKVCLK